MPIPDVSKSLTRSAARNFLAAIHLTAGLIWLN
jgi:hypothetical protein